LTVTTLADPGLAPRGQHLLSAATGIFDKNRLSPELSRRHGETFFTELKKLIPQLEDHLFPAPSASSPEGYLIHEFEPIYGWALTPGQFGLKRLSQYPPVEGLYLAGQWTRPGPGVMPAQVSALVLVQALLNKAS
jgi:phytoene dehydrogenase-like protein